MQFKLEFDIHSSRLLLKYYGLCWLRIWGSLGLNQGPTGYESAALTTELLPHSGKRIILKCIRRGNVKNFLDYISQSAIET